MKDVQTAIRKELTNDEFDILVEALKAYHGLLVKNNFNQSSEVLLSAAAKCGFCLEN